MRLLTPLAAVAVLALAACGRLTIIEIKSSTADFRADRKWHHYREFCDRFYFAVPPTLEGIIPEEAGLIVADGFGVERVDVMYNDFVIVGPSDDPAGIKASSDVLQALNTIAQSGAPFASRGDDSGTHQRELALWSEAGMSIDPAALPWYRDSGSGMGRTLRIAAELDEQKSADRDEQQRGDRPDDGGPGAESGELEWQRRGGDRDDAGAHDRREPVRRQVRHDQSRMLQLPEQAPRPRRMPDRGRCAGGGESCHASSLSIAGTSRYSDRLGGAQ